jgi:hypothetical protein
MMIFGRSGTSSKIFLPTQNLEALLILLRLAHGQQHEVPTELPFQTLFDVAILCEKYKTLGLVMAHRIHWLNIITSSLREGRLEDRLSVSQIFQHAPSFAEVLSEMIIETALDTQWKLQRDHGLSFIPNPPQAISSKIPISQPGAEFTFELSITSEGFAKTVLDFIRSTRERYLERISSIIASVIDDLFTAQTDNSLLTFDHSCRHMYIGFVMSQLRELGIWTPTTACQHLLSAPCTLRELWMRLADCFREVSDAMPGHSDSSKLEAEIEQQWDSLRKCVEEYSKTLGYGNDKGEVNPRKVSDQ